jgi:amphi-Trp domain-containing protein
MDKKRHHAPHAQEGRFTYDSVQDARSLSKYLQALKEGFEAGHIAFSRTDQELTLSPSGLIGFSVEAKGKEGRMKLTLKFTWRESDDSLPKDLDALEISI